MQIGCHVSIAGSIDKAVDNAVKENALLFRYLQEIQEVGTQKISPKMIFQILNQN